MLYLLFALSLLFPVQAPIQDGHMVDVGSVGPGQAFEVAINKVVEEGGIYGEGGYYDYAFSPNPPEGWEVIPSKRQETPLRVVIKAPPDAEEGYYVIPISLVDYMEKLPPVTFYIRVKVVKDIFDSEVSPREVSVGVGQPVRLTFHILNKGSIGDAFSLSMVCYFQDGREVKRVEKLLYVPPLTERSIPVELSLNIRGSYTCSYVVEHLPSGQKEEGVVKIEVKPSLQNDLKALSRGALILYPFHQLAYSFISLLSLIM